jgi:soluble lytic murein transglycosylase
MPPLRQIAAAFMTLSIAGCSIINPAPVPTAVPPIPTATLWPTPAATATATATLAPTATPLPQTRVQSGDDAFALGDYEAAMDAYKAAYDASADPDIRASAIYGEGRIFHARQDDVSAIQSFQSVLDNFPDAKIKPEVFYWLGQIYDGLKRYSDAADAYAQYLALRPGVIDAYVQELRGDALVSAGDDSSAIPAYEAAAQAPRLGAGYALKLKIADAYIRNQDYTKAIDLLNNIYTGSSSTAVRANADFYAGKALLAQGDAEGASERYLDAVNNFPQEYGAYAALLQMVNGGMTVSDVQRGVVDYYAGQYQVAITALDRAIQNGEDTDGTALYFEGMSLSALEQYPEAISAWDTFIQNYPQNPHWASAWEEKAAIQWADLDKFDEAAQTLLSYVKAAPSSAEAPGNLYEAGRIYEREDKLEEAAATWQRLVDEYPAADQSFRGLFLAGICRYRQGKLPEALNIFQKAMLIATAAGDQAAAGVWVGKLQQQQGDAQAAKATWLNAASLDPTGYYSERAQDLADNRPPFDPPQQFDFGIDMAGERTEAEKWLRNTFPLDANADLSDLGNLASDPRFIRGAELLRLGLKSEARDELDALRVDLQADPVGLYRLMNYLYANGLYSTAIFASRQILTLAHLDDAGTLTAPAYFNHIRFGDYYRSLVLQGASDEDLDPLLMLSVIRQESMFDNSAGSGAGALGLMQIMPATGLQIADNLGWPAYFTSDDLYRPNVSIRLGAHYLAQQRAAFDGDLFAALAAYNGGPGNTAAWQSLAPNDPDLFLEVVRIQETRNYIMYIYEIYDIYRLMYSHSN